MAKAASFSCIFQPLDVHSLYDEIAIDRIANKPAHKSKPTVYKKLKHVDFFYKMKSNFSTP